MTEPTITREEDALAYQILDALNPIGCCEMTLDEAVVAVRIIREAAVAELRAEVERKDEALGKIQRCANARLVSDIECMTAVIENSFQHIFNMSRTALSQKETSHDD